MEYLALFKALEEKKVEYLLCGGLAVNIYGIPRMTADIDFLIKLTEQNVLEFESVMNNFNYKPLLPVTFAQLFKEEFRIDLVKNKNLIAYSFYNSVKNMMSIDVLIDSPLSFDKMWIDKEVREVENTLINLASVSHIIKMKEYSNRVQDREDIINLKKFI
jgi:hypothetical protein